MAVGQFCASTSHELEMASQVSGRSWVPCTLIRKAQLALAPQSESFSQNCRQVAPPEALPAQTRPMAQLPKLWPQDSPFCRVPGATQARWVTPFTTV